MTICIKIIWTFLLKISIGHPKNYGKTYKLKTFYTKRKFFNMPIKNFEICISPFFISKLLQFLTSTHFYERNNMIT